jgi:NADH-quinone oxidoreductase subunit N
MSGFLLSLAGIPPLAGWFAKFVMFRAVFEAGGAGAVTLGVIAAVNSVIAFFYYAGVARRIWFEEPAAELTGTARVPAALTVALAMSALVVLVIGVYPQPFARVGELAVPL